MKSFLIRNGLFIVLILLTLLNTYVILRNKGILDIKINDSIARVQEQVDKIKEPTDGRDGYTPVKGIDYFDGKDGRDGKDSISTHTIETRTIVEQVPVNGKNGNDGVDGKTPEFRCNDTKNRWEIRYIGDPNWSVLRNMSDNSSIKCSIGKGD